jgi:Stress responsive A/B Barrel Domain
VIRFVVTIKLIPGGEEKIDLPAVWDGLSKIDTPGVLAFHAGFDTRQHYESNWSFAVVIDFTDFEAFNNWFEHPDHRRLGKPCEPFIADTSRVVYEFHE